MTDRLLHSWEEPTPSPVCPKSLLSLGFGDYDPALVLGNRLRFLDEYLVAHLAGVVLVMRLVLLGRTHGLLHHRVGEAPFDLNDNRLLVLVADDGALQNALWHVLVL